jgi:hypothetical protein
MDGRSLCIVDDKVKRGARGATQEMNTIVDYLPKNFGAE